MRNSSRGKAAVIVGVAVFSMMAVTTPMASATTLLYQWNFDQNGGTGTIVTPSVTPNSLATDGGVVTMAQFGGFAYTPTNLYTASGGGVSGAAGDYALNTSASVSNNPNPGGIGYSSGAADPNNANTVNALPNIGVGTANPMVTITMWVKPTTAELLVQSRLFMLGTSQSYDGAATGLYVGLNTGKAEVKGGGSAYDQIIGNSLVANTWNFLAFEVDLGASNVFFDTAMQAATGSQLIGATAAQDSFVYYQGDQADNNYTYTGQGGWTNGTVNYAAQANYVQISNRFNGANRAFQGQGDDYRIYSGLLTTSQLQAIAAEAPVPEPASLVGLTAIGSMLLLRRKRAQV